MTLEGVQNLIVIQIMDTPAGKDHQIQACKLQLMSTKTFPYQTFDTITINRQLKLLLANCQTQPGIRLRIRSTKNGQIRITGAGRVIKDLFELARFQQTLGPGEIAR